MRKKLCISSLFLIFFLVLNSQAMDLKGKLALTIGGGINVPTGSFSNWYHGGFGSGIELEYFASSQSSAGFHFNYNTFEPEVITSSIYDTFEKYKIMSCGFFVSRYFSAKREFIPYGRIRFDVNIPRWLGKNGDPQIGISAGVGGKFQVGEMIMLGAEGMYHLAKIKFKHEPTLYATIRVTLTFLLAGERNRSKP